jgi:hypothetical protein
MSHIQMHHLNYEDICHTCRSKSNRSARQFETVLYSDLERQPDQTTSPQPNHTKKSMIKMTRQTSAQNVSSTVEPYQHRTRIYGNKEERGSVERNPRQRNKKKR